MSMWQEIFKGGACCGCTIPIDAAATQGQTGNMASAPVKPRNMLYTSLAFAALGAWMTYDGSEFKYTLIGCRRLYSSPCSYGAPSPRSGFNRLGYSAGTGSFVRALKSSSALFAASSSS